MVIKTKLQCSVLCNLLRSAHWKTDLVQTGTLGSWILRNISHNPKIEEHFDQSTANFVFQCNWIWYQTKNHQQNVPSLHLLLNVSTNEEHLQSQIQDWGISNTFSRSDKMKWWWWWGEVNRKLAASSYITKYKIMIIDWSIIISAVPSRPDSLYLVTYYVNVVF